jgi:integrase
MAKAEKLPSGKWRVRVQSNGHSRTFIHENKKIAEASAKAWQTGIIKTARPTEKITLQEAYEKFIEIKKYVLSPSTILGYTNLRRTSFQDIMHLRLEQIESVSVQRSINMFAANHSPKSVKNAYGLFTAVMSMFMPDSHFNVKLPQKQPKEIYIPTDEDIKRLVQLSKGTSMYIPILLAAFGGMREGEICALTKEDINGNFVTINKSMVLTPSKEWKIKPPKTISSNRKVEMPQFVINALNEKNGRLVTLNPHVVSINFSRLIKNNGFVHFRFHDLRHYYVSSLHSLNIPDKYIQAQGGWSTNHTMNNVYKHIMESKKSEFSNTINEHFEAFLN